MVFMMKSSEVLVADAPVFAHTENPPTPQWRPLTRVAFRFVCFYLVLYSIPFPIGALPGTEKLGDKSEELWHIIVPWVGKHLLRLKTDITIFSNGSGDTTYDYVKVLCFLLITFAATLLWTALDRRRTHYTTLYKWLRLYLRLVLGAAMLLYGASKVIPSQFPAPSLYRLVSTYGDSSPMGILWTFMGASTAYEIFAGLAEVGSGILLFIPRLTTLGSLMASAVLLNIFMLNMCYDVPVKLYSFHLLLMGVFLSAPDLRRLFGLFALRRQVELYRDPPLFERQRFNESALALQLVLGAFLLVSDFYLVHNEKKQYSARPAHYGMWAVEDYTLDGQPHPLLLTDAARWRRVFLEYEGFMVVQPMSGPRLRFLLKTDDKQKTFTLTKPDNKEWQAVLALDDSQPDVLLLKGTLDGHALAARLVKENASNFLLVNRGFHWINEYPFNR
jgi:uncharacterized membrane protein YphA (DoxX/SURF4 family)